jgi:glycosyltransferase involved in cell wall biosynthesis
MMSNQLPFVSIITCTYNRPQFFRTAQLMVKAQDYPHDKMEWIIMDDTPGVDSSESFPTDLDGIKVHYYYLKQKIPLATKRNLLNHKASGKYIINMDDDDYYPPCRVSHAVHMLMEHGTPLAGTTVMYMYFAKDKKIYKLGPYRKDHGTAATLAYTKEYTNSHNFGDGHYAEEGVFTEGWKHPMVQLDPLKTVLALSHSDNTIEKTIFLEQKYGHVGRTVNSTDMILTDFMDKDKESDVYKFYDQLEYTYKENQYTAEVRNKMDETIIQAAAQYRQVAAQKMIQDLTIMRLVYEKEMLFIHNKNVGRLVVQQQPPS